MQFFDHASEAARYRRFRPYFHPIVMERIRQALARAVNDECVSYVQGSAENLPVQADSCDLMTVSSAFHWLDRERFLHEAARVLRPRAWLVIYDNWFAGIMYETPKFASWHTDVYLHRYPVPPRDARPIDAEQVHRYGFALLDRENFENDVQFTVDELVGYLTTQTNVVAAVENGNETLESVISWLHDEVTPLFAGPSATFQFGGGILYLQRRDPSDNS